VAEFHKLIANLRDALEHPAAEAHNGAAAASPVAVPTTKAARRVELASQFARELQVVGGYLLGLIEVLAFVRFGSNVEAGVAFAALFLMLVLRPQGLFGARLKERL